MVLSRRERYIGIATCAILGGVALYKLVAEPLWQQRVDLDGQLRVEQRLVIVTSVMRMGIVAVSTRQRNRLICDIPPVPVARKVILLKSFSFSLRPAFCDGRANPASCAQSVTL